jgi:hypothetical protein
MIWFPYRELNDCCDETSVQRARIATVSRGARDITVEAPLEKKIRLREKRAAAGEKSSRHQGSK